MMFMSQMMPFFLKEFRQHWADGFAEETRTAWELSTSLFPFHFPLFCWVWMPNLPHWWVSKAFSGKISSSEVSVTSQPAKNYAAFCPCSLCWKPWAEEYCDYTEDRQCKDGLQPSPSTKVLTRPRLHFMFWLSAFLLFFLHLLCSSQRGCIKETDFFRLVVAYQEKVLYYGLNQYST